MKAYYDTVDFYYYLKDSLMPDIDVTHTTAALEAAKLNSINLSPVAVLNLTSSTSSATATSAIISMARTLVNNNYQVKVSNPDTTFVDNVWSGIFIVTNYADDEDTYTTQRISVQINGDYEKYTKQRIEKTLANSVKENKYGIIELFSLNETNFKLELRKYSLERLRSFHDSCQSCLDILIQQGIADKNSWANKDPDLYRELYLPYYNKLHYIEDEMDIRQSEIDIVIGKFDEYGEIVTQGMQTIIESEKNMIQDVLNFEKYLGTDLWLEFVAYRREDTYENMNFISDGLNNQELFEKALEFIDVARKDIFKSATLQHSISASLKNLLVMKEFEPIVDYFEVGNWIRVKVDDKIYRLRLLDYEIDFDNLENINIKFSDVNIVSDGFSDVESVLNQAASIATSYGEVSRQAKQGKKSNDQLNEWVSKGLALTKMKIVDSADNQDISWDNHGFLCREYLPIIDDYDAKQLKIISKGLYVTDDNWESSRAGIGNFTFWNPKTQKVEESYGVIADTIIGNIILGEELGIYNRNNSIILDEDGLSVNDVDNHSSRALNDEEDCNRVMISTSEVNKYLIGESINIGTRRGRNDIATNRIIQSISTNGDNSYIVFSGSPVDMASDYYVSTNFTTIQINPNNGDGLFTIGTSLNGNIMKVDENGNGYYYGQMNVANGAFKVLSDGSLNIGDGNFVVDAEGNVTAKKGSFKGDITGATGTFSGQLNVNNNFIVDSTGSVTAKSGSFKGDITGSSGTFGGQLNVNNKFIVDSSGNVNMNGSITLGGNITWSSSNSPVQCQYSSNGSSWHTSFYSSDYYARYSYDGGITWTSAIQIRGIMVETEKMAEMDMMEQMLPSLGTVFILRYIQMPLMVFMLLVAIFVFVQRILKQDI